MSAEYSVGEIHKAAVEDYVSERVLKMLLALAERIKADEAKALGTCPKHGIEYVGECSGCAMTLPEKDFTDPPAQAAQVECDHKWMTYFTGAQQIYWVCAHCYNRQPAITLPAPTAEPVAQGEVYLAGDAEEVAESLSDDAELVRRKLGPDNEVSENMERAAEILRTAAQPRAVPDVKAMADRLMGWRLPDDFAPDAGISFIKPTNPEWWPTGTNLFTVDQAEQMFRYVLAAAPQPGESS